MNVLVVFFFVALGLVLGLVLAALAVSQRHGHLMGGSRLLPSRFMSWLAARFEAWSRVTSRKMTPASTRLLTLSHGHIVSQCIFSVVKLGIADAMERDPRPAAAIAEELELHEDTVARLLRLLAAHGCFEAVGLSEHMYRHNSVSVLLRRDHPRSLCSTMLMLAESYPAWARTAETVETGERVYPKFTGGISFRNATFPAVGEGGKPRKGHHLLRAAEVDRYRLSEGALLADYRWSQHHRLLDMGGGPGRLLSAVLRSNAMMGGVLWVRPDGIESTKAWWQRFVEDLGDRLKFVVGETVAALPAVGAGDALLLSFVLGTLEDTAAVAHLSSLRHEVGAARVTLIVADMVLDERESNHAKLLLDAQARGLGPIRHRTRTDWTALLQLGGFQVDKIVRCRGRASLILASP
ncbi:MAG: methyltransferase, partial [Myxococcota bacterium]|nr:methyltransferase [Myxococcota bacterium]